MGKRRTEQEWQKLFEAFSESGENCRSFCRRQGLCDSHFGKKYREWQRPKTVTAIRGDFTQVRVEPKVDSPALKLRWREVDVEFPARTSSAFLVDFLSQLSRVD